MERSARRSYGKIFKACGATATAATVILDAGGGEGRMAAQLAARGHEVVLCDLSAQMIDRAKLQAIALGGGAAHSLRTRCDTAG